MAESVIEFSLEAVDRFSKVFGNLGKALGVAGSIWASTGGAVVAFSKAVADQIGKFDDLAKRTGVAATSLMELDHVAKLSGTTLENVTTSIQFLQRGMDDAQFGLGQAARGFERLGISVTDTSGKMKSSQAVMHEVADAIQNIEDPAQKTKIAMDLFGRSGTQMIQLMEGGSARMHALAADARFLGVSLSEQAIANAAKFGDEVDRVTSAVKGASFAIAGEWIPVLTGMTRAVANFIAESLPAIREFAQGFMRFMIGAFVVVETIATTVWNGLNGLFTAKGFDNFIKNFIEGAKRAFTYVLELSARSAETLARVLWEGSKVAWTAFYEIAKWAWMKVFDFISGQNLADTLGEVLFERIPEAAREHIDKFKGALGEYGDLAVEAFTDAGSAIAGTFGLSMDGINQRIDQIIEKFTVLGDTVKENTDSKITPSLLEMFQKMEAQKQQRLEQLEAEIFFAQTFTEVWTLTIEQLNAQLLNWNQVSSQLITDTFLSVSAGIGQAVSNAIVFSQNLGDALRNVLKQAAANIISMLIQVGVQRLILSVLSIGANKTQAANEIGTGLAKVYVNSFASAAAIPFVGWAMAPGVAAMNATIAAGGAATAGAAGAGLGASLGGAAHGGLTNVPAEQTFLLDKGERVLSPSQNEDLTEFLDGGGSGGVIIQNLSIEVLPNATSFDSLMNMSPMQIREVVASKMIEALNSLDRMGIRPVFAERVGR